MNLCGSEIHTPTRPLLVACKPSKLYPRAGHRQQPQARSCWCSCHPAQRRSMQLHRCFPPSMLRVPIPPRAWGQTCASGFRASSWAAAENMWFSQNWHRQRVQGDNEENNGVLLRGAWLYSKRRSSSVSVLVCEDRRCVSMVWEAETRAREMPTSKQRSSANFWIPGMWALETRPRCSALSLLSFSVRMLTWRCSRLEYLELVFSPHSAFFLGTVITTTCLLPIPHSSKTL